MAKHTGDLDADPILIPHKGRLQWLFPSGRLVPDIRGGEGDDPPEKKFTQEDVDRMIANRLKNVKAEPPADYDELKNKAKQFDQLEAANKTEVERLTAENTKLTEQLATATSTSSKASEDLATERKRNAVYAEAAKQKAINPEQIFALLASDAVTIGDDGKVTGADKAVESFLKDNGHFVGTPARRGPAPDPAQAAKGEQTAKTGREAGMAEAERRFGKPATAGALQ
jgi:hypothetical protein